MIPKVAFRPMTLDENIDVIDWAYFENNGSLDVHNYVLEYYPELSNLEGCDKDIILDRIRDVVSRDYYYYEQKIKDEVIRYQDIWDKYNDNYMLDVSKYLDCDWDDICSISASVGLIPVFPRYLDTHSFCLSTNISEDKLIKTCAVFGGIEILAPENVNIKVKSIPIFGATSNKTGRKYDEKLPTIYVDSFCMFGGVDIK